MQFQLTGQRECAHVFRARPSQRDWGARFCFYLERNRTMSEATNTPTPLGDRYVWSTCEWVVAVTSGEVVTKNDVITTDAAVTRLIPVHEERLPDIKKSGVSAGDLMVSLPVAKIVRCRIQRGFFDDMENLRNR
jgi:hypothetical protein